MISIILVEPGHAGNIGAVARAMANFGFSRLVLVSPKCSHLSNEAIKRSKHAVSVLKKAKKTTWLKARKEFHTLAATTSQIGNDYNIPRSPITPVMLADIIKPDVNIGIVFGREGIGLTNKEVLDCDFIVTIPTSREYPTMNVSHAASVVLYELFKCSKSRKQGDHIVYATNIEKQQIMKMLNRVLDTMKFATERKRQTQIKVWKRMVSKSFLTRREAYALMGFFKKIMPK